MGVRDKLLDFKRRLSDRHMYSIILVVTAIIASTGIYQYKKALDYRNYLNNQYSRAFYELTNYVDDLDVSLAKAMLVNTPRQMAETSSEIWRKSAFAQANLGILPISHIQLDKTARFLSQVGDYTYSLSRKSIDDQPISDKEFEKLNQLRKYAASLKDNLNSMQEEISDGSIKFGEINNKGKRYLSKAAKEIGTTRFENIEKEFKEYPSLIYDGPFSDHIENIKPRLLEGKKEITQEQAQERVSNFIGKDKAKNIEFAGEDNGDIHLYRFRVDPDGQESRDGERRISIGITKVGGYALWMLDNREVMEHKLDIEEAKKKAGEFLQARGFNSMMETYYLKNDGIAVINYAYMQNDVIMYPDLIKVKIALDNGEVLGFESKGYITGHKDVRQLPPVNITQEEAKAKINPRLTVDSVRFAVIPLESKREVLCYEFKGNFEDNNFLIYVNAETGKEEKILMLLETPEGTLTM